MSMYQKSTFDYSLTLKLQLKNLSSDLRINKIDIWWQQEDGEYSHF